ncbi:MAG: S-methyl-5'-thioadenosine phosphorylase [Phycisphaerae bacterium]
MGVTTARVGIIGGTGLGEWLAERVGGKRVDVETPYGPPSTAPVLARWDGVDVAFVSRHGPGHRYNPSTVPYRANIWAMKRLGVSSIIASGATGSLREDIAPGELVLCDQVIDRTYRRANTFFDEGPVVHVELADPVCPRLRAALRASAGACDARVHDGGTYVCMEGPQFSTRAESLMHRQWGGDLIGMTCMPEAKLAREAEICYAMIAFATDYDCWRPGSTDRAPDALLKEITTNLHRAGERAASLIRAALGAVADADASTACGCQTALKLAIWSDRSRIEPATRTRLEPLIERYLADNRE